MKYQNFIMRILCLLLILAAVVGYNSMQKKKIRRHRNHRRLRHSQSVWRSWKNRIRRYSALEEAAKNQEAAIAQAQRDAKRQR